MESTATHSNDGKRLLTKAEAAERLGVTEHWIDRAVFRKTIPYVKVGKFVRFTEVDLEAFVAANRVDETG